MLAQGEFAHQRQRDALAYPEEAAQEHHHGDGTQHADAQLITPGGIALAQLRHQPRQANGDQKARHAAQYEAPGLAGYDLVVAGGHGIDQRTIRHVDGGIAHGQQQIGAERPGDFHAHAGVRDGKGQHADDADGKRDPQLPGTKTSPAALRAVSNHAHHRIGNCVKYPQGNEQRADERGRQAKHIGIEKGQKIHDQTGDYRAARVAQAVANFFVDRQPVIGYLFCNFCVCNRCGSHGVTPR